MATSFFGGEFFGGEFFHSGGPTPPPTPTLPQSGVRNRKRRWGIRHRGKSYYFEELRDLQRFALALPTEALAGESKAKAKPKIIVPVETVREAQAMGLSGLQKLADRADYDSLLKIAERMERGDEEADAEDFMEFIEFIRTV